MSLATTNLATMSADPAAEVVAATLVLVATLGLVVWSVVRLDRATRRHGVSPPAHVAVVTAAWAMFFTAGLWLVFAIAGAV